MTTPDCLSRLKDDRLGVSAVEYGLIAAVMSAFLVAIFAAFGSDLAAAFSEIGSILRSGL